MSVKAQQEEYTGFLEQALKAAKNRDEKNFNTNLQYFSTAIERDNITPEILTDENFELYTKALFESLSNKLNISDELAKRAFEFLKHDIDNYPENMFSLGYLYYGGLGITQDYAKAKYWYEKAAEAGNANAMNSLGYMYAEGLGGAQDYNKAKYWYKKACDAGDQDACEILKKMN